VVRPHQLTPSTCPVLRHRGSEHRYFPFDDVPGKRYYRSHKSIVADLVQESDYIKDRLMTAETAEEILEVIRTGEQAALD